MRTDASLPLMTSNGEIAGTLHIHCLPNRESSGGMETLVVNTEDDSVVQLLEAHEYRYKIELVNGTIESVEPQEIFTRDDNSWMRGRIKAGLNTGLITTWIQCEDGSKAVAEFEIRSRKLDYLTDYQKMLGSLASESAELLMMRFSPSKLTAFAPKDDDDAMTLYQRFAFLQSILRKPSFQSAIAMLLHRPHEQYTTEAEVRNVGRGMQGTSNLVRQFARSGPKRENLAGGPIDMVPSRISVDAFAPTFDTEPNRFVRMVYEHWRGLCIELRDAMQKDAESLGPARRGVAEANELIAELDEVLLHPVFRDVSKLTHVPIANQVLQQRAGYREVSELFVLIEAAAQLRWDDGDFVFRAGQRDVATLYEYWCYLQLRRILERMCGSHDLEDGLFEVSKDGITLGLRKGKGCVFRSVLHRMNRKMIIELWFNRSFQEESWSKEMIPDCSIRIRPESMLGSEPTDVWMHFDAKYRVKSSKEILNDDASNHEGGEAKRTDLLKMHAYKDAIRRSAGAYVLFPGGESKGQVLKTYRELLPGIGAFPFRVGENGEADENSAEGVRAHIDEVIDQVANQASDLERSRYWHDRTISEARSVVSVTKTLTKPPQDTSVLLGYVKSAKHLRWIEQELRYNLRADDRDGSVAHDQRALGADIVMLYGDQMESPRCYQITGSPLIRTAKQMIATGYEEPSGQLYCLLPLEPLIDMELPVTSEQIALVLQSLQEGFPRGYPRVVNWSQLTGSDSADV